LAQTSGMLRRNILSISVALVIIYLSLANAQTFDEIPVFHFPGEDKVIHFGMYAVLMGALLYENRKIIDTRCRLALIAVIPILLGALLEVLQMWLTTTRFGSIYDLLFNIFGILFSIGIYLLVINRRGEKIK
jgi:VanZ family protein